MATRRNLPCPSRAISAFTLVPAGSVRRTRFSLPSRTPSTGGWAVMVADMARNLCSSAEFNQASRPGDGIGEAPGTGLPLPRDAEGRAVVGARPHLRQAHCHIHRLVEIDHLERRQALVVIKRHDHVELPAQR